MLWQRLYVKTCCLSCGGYCWWSTIATGHTSAPLKWFSWETNGRQEALLQKRMWVFFLSFQTKEKSILSPLPQMVTSFCFSPNALKPTLTMSMVLITCSNNGSGLNFPEYYLQEDLGQPLCLPWNFIRTWRLGLTISLIHVNLGSGWQRVGFGIDNGGNGSSWVDLDQPEQCKVICISKQTRLFKKEKKN